MDPLAAIGPAGLATRWQEGRRLIHENGITYNIYGDPESMSRLWPLDPIPLMMERHEWEAIENAVRQRAALLNALLVDLYGPQRLLRDGLLPPELVFRHPAFQRPLHSVALPGDVYLHTYSADLTRSTDGRWWVLADRTQAPSGAGYALENRLVSARVLPDIFRASNVHRLAMFFHTYRETLRRLLPNRRENPRIVLLTPGPYNETYFEHAFLARYLGYTLVEGGDLTVRENRVFMKTLGGLLPVDVIVRRQDDDYCDPLEFRGDSMLGVPGLTQVVRSGNVAVTNALGSGLIESAAYSAFLPGLCRHVLGEDLKMPTVATWWCGEEGPFSFVTGNLERLVIKPAFPRPDVQPIFASQLSLAERQKLIEKMRVAPARYVGQEQASLSTVPVWEDGVFEPRHMVLRVFAVATGGGSYAVMPGGLTRFGASSDSLVVSMQGGGGSKDTWVLAEGPTPQFSLLRPSSAPLEVSRATIDLPSRVADNLFWLGRYVERVESAVRVARAILPRVYQESDPALHPGFNACMKLLSALGYLSLEPSTAELRGAALEHELLTMIYDSDSRGSLAWNVHRIRRVAWLLRDRISADAWNIVNHFDQQFSPAPLPEALQISAAQTLLDNAVIMLSAFSGMAMESMTRGHGWRFLDIGRRLERAAQMVDVLRYGLGQPSLAVAGQLEVLLEIADSSLTYRSRYLTTMQVDLVLDLLLLDEANPRSIAFQLSSLRHHIEQLPESQPLARRPAEARLALGMQTAVQLAEIAELVHPDSHGQFPTLDNLLNRLASDLRLLSETLTGSYFDHAVRSRPLSAS
jgi:uncharacterized circularly permuted ATP-grasp superfamily protein/uncharacterized alpha-E superfamily protein